MPDLSSEERRRPLCYDPGRRKFIMFDEIVSGDEKIVPVDSLAKKDFKKLVLERQRLGPDYRMQPISGPLMTRDDVVRAIESDEPAGQVAMQAEKSMLRDLLAEIERNL
ncbi:MAG: hypothetical protein ABIE70_00655 [bacterium]